MAGTKRKQVTADDVIRMQEKPAKRRRPSSDLEDEESAVGFNSATEHSDAEASDVEYGVGDGEGNHKAVMLDAGDGSSSESDSDEDGHAQVVASSRVDNEDSSTSRIVLKGKQSLAPSIHLAPKSTTFASLGIAPPLIAAMAGMSIRAPTEIQSACIPTLLAGKSVCTAHMDII